MIQQLPLKRMGLTPFTYSRFLVPQLCNYEGWALFLDLDMLVQGDIAELFDLADESQAVMVVKSNARFEWASVMKDHFTLVIYSSRSKDINMQAKMYLWLMDRWHDWIASHSPIGDFIVYGDFEFAHQKPSAFITIDDRCICFNGDWSAITADRIFSFKPWNKS